MDKNKLVEYGSGPIPSRGNQNNRGIPKGRNKLDEEKIKKIDKPLCSRIRPDESFPPDIPPSNGEERWRREGSQSGGSDSQSAAAHRVQLKLAHRPRSNTPSENALGNPNTKGRDGAHGKDATKILRRKEAFRDEEISRAKEEALREATKSREREKRLRAQEKELKDANMKRRER
ncbi:hypothetical protein EAF00_007960 [Botryotinia globosa]|nr:hypothetical protein EAF00_007960 [Botryotinia globosa]